MTHGAVIMTHRDGFPRFSARRVWRGDAHESQSGHREPRATLSESLGKPPPRSAMRPVGGRRKVLTMPRIACDLAPTRPPGTHQAAWAIPMGHYHRSLVLPAPGNRRRTLLCRPLAQALGDLLEQSGRQHAVIEPPR